jgi:hypothetical protein
LGCQRIGHGSTPERKKQNKKGVRTERTRINAVSLWGRLCPVRLAKPNWVAANHMTFTGRVFFYASCVPNRTASVGGAFFTLFSLGTGDCWHCSGD